MSGTFSSWLVLLVPSEIGWLLKGWPLLRWTLPSHRSAANALATCIVQTPQHLLCSGQLPSCHAESRGCSFVTGLPRWNSQNLRLLSLPHLQNTGWKLESIRKPAFPACVLIPSHYLQSQKDACSSFLPCGTSPVIGKLSQRETSLRLVYATMSWLVLSLTADMKSHINYASKREQLSPFITFIQFWIIFEISLQSIGVRYGIPMLTYVVICLVCLFPLSFPIPSSPV